jgi:hypothetical protein
VRPHEKLSSQVRCVECRREAPVGEHGWRAYLTEDEGKPAEAVLYCPDCVRREFEAEA